MILSLKILHENSQKKLSYAWQNESHNCVISAWVSFFASLTSLVYPFLHSFPELEQLPPSLWCLQWLLPLSLGPFDYVDQRWMWTCLHSNQLCCSSIVAFCLQSHKSCPTHNYYKTWHLIMSWASIFIKNKNTHYVLKSNRQQFTMKQSRNLLSFAFS